MAWLFHSIRLRLTQLTNRFIVIRIQNRFCKITFHHLIMLFSICVVIVMLCCRCSHSTFYGPLPDVPADYRDRLYRCETSHSSRSKGLHTFCISQWTAVNILYFELVLMTVHAIKGDRCLSLKKWLLLISCHPFFFL